MYEPQAAQIDSDAFEPTAHTTCGCFQAFSMCSSLFYVETRSETPRINQNYSVYSISFWSWCEMGNFLFWYFAFHEHIMPWERELVLNFRHLQSDRLVTREYILVVRLIDAGVSSVPNCLQDVLSYSTLHLKNVSEPCAKIQLARILHTFRLVLYCTLYLQALLLWHIPRKGTAWHRGRNLKHLPKHAAFSSQLSASA